MTLSPSLAPLKAYRQWINWQLEPDPARPDKPRKIPINPKTGGRASTTDPSTWCDYETAAATGGNLGFVFVEGGGLWFLDLDNCLDKATGDWTQLAKDLIKAFGGQAACEVSQSKRGLHLIGRAAKIPAHTCKNSGLGLELYHTARFIALTDDQTNGFIGSDTSDELAVIITKYFTPIQEVGDVQGWTDTPQGGAGISNDDDELIAGMRRMRSIAAILGSKASFSDLFDANVEALGRAFPDNGGQQRPYDGSSADMALAMHLAFGTAKNCERIERLMWRSGLRRDKWNRADYLKRTILKACAKTINVANSRVADMSATYPTIHPYLASSAATECPRPLYRDLPPPEAYPMDALGPVLGAAAKAISAVIQCPDEVAANSVLAVASLAAQGVANVILPIGPGKAAPLSLFLLTVVESGERKSSADSMALKPVRDFERQLTESGERERQDFSVKLSAYDATAKHLSAKMKADRAGLEDALRELGPVPQPPLLSILAASGDQTMEGLFRIYQQGRPSLALLCDDAASFLGGHSLKAEQKQSTTANLCRAWDGSRLERIRGGDGVIILYDRRLACHLMVQPGVAAGFISDAQFADQGLLARFLLSAPAGLAGTRFRDDTAYKTAAFNAAHDMDDYNAAVARLLCQRIRWKDDADRTLGVELAPMDLSPDARAAYVAFCNSIEHQLVPGGGLSMVKAFASKLPENAVRIAGVLTLIDDPDARAISAKVLSDAIRLAHYHLEEAKRLTAAGAIDPELRSAETLRQWLRERPSGVIALRTIYQHGPNAIRSAGKARSAMKLLEEHGWVIPTPGAVIDGTTCREAWEIVRC